MSKLNVFATVTAALALTSSLYMNLEWNDSLESRAPANDAAANDPAYLKDYDYGLTELDSFAKAQDLYDSLNKEFKITSICANRAHVWSYDLLRKKGIRTGKVFIHFTPIGIADEDITWAYHVAPYVIVKEKKTVNGQEVVEKKEYVLDAGFRAFHGPITLQQWSKYFGKSSNCVELDPLSNPEHLKLEANNVGTKWSERERCGLTSPDSPSLSPCLKNIANAVQYPIPQGSTCYVRKTPMYYWMPAGYYGNDLYQSGMADYNMYNMGQDFNDEQLVYACRNAINGSGLFKKKFCKKYLGFGSDD